MAIRMKEWGMLAAPGRPVDVRTQGLNHWGSAGQALGEGLSDVLNKGLKEVCGAGELAAFSHRLKDIGAAVREDLQEGEVKDWNYAWNASAAPRIAEAVQELSADVRERGLEMARTYSAQASIEALRDRELQRVATARGQWQQRVDDAVSSGEDEQAALWLEAGRGVFVPEEEMESRQQELRSRASLSRWESRLQAAPLETLSELASPRARKAADLPTRAEESRRLEQSCARARQGLRRELAQQFSDHLRQGEEPAADALELAGKAGLLPPRPKGERAAKRKELPETTPASTRIAWRRWVDQRAEGEDGELDSRLAIAAAPLPLPERRALLERLERTAGASVADRRTMDNRLYSLYSSGALGCPADAEAQRALLALQDEGAALLAEQGAEAVSDWLAARQQAGGHWVCYEASGDAR